MLLRLCKILTLVTVVAGSNRKTVQPITKGSMDSSYNFLMHGDWGWNSFNQTLTSYEMAVYAWLVNAEFVIALGDNFYEDGVTDTHDELWDTAFHDVYASPALNVKWYGVLGNHDYHGNIEAQIDRSVVSGETMWYMPATYYSIDYELKDGGILTIVYIDTCLLDPYAKDTEDILNNANWVEERTNQLEWIDNTLAAAALKSNWIVVAGHYPIYSIGEHGDDQYLIDDLLPLLLDHGVHAYFAGHDHLHQHIYKDGLHHITSGNSAGRGPFDEHGYAYLGVSAATNQVLHWFLDCGFAITSVDKTHLNVTFVDNHGQVRYSASMGEPLNAKSFYDTTKLKGLGISPKMAGVIILVPVLALAVGLILYLGKDWYLNKDGKFDMSPKNISKSNPEEVLKSMSALTLRRKTESNKYTDDDYSDIDSSTWSNLDVSTDRLRPSRHGG
mmetsp:Transcript_9282/g.13986  ORF Transcript_9282/g.13986 Transcript_9282/m.13986 type:complete len:443 (-) Transcript_9282:100-1428(-)